jgi:hypothetical protein
MRTFTVKPNAHRQTAPARWAIADRLHSVQAGMVNTILHDFSRISINAQTPVETLPKLAVNTRGHAYEHEVDRIPDPRFTSGAGRTGMDQRFGYDFSRLSVHTEAMSPFALLGHARNALMGSLGEGAARIAIQTTSTETIGAEGMTVGRRVHLAPGRFDTQSHEGRVRLGHEVAHAIQQERGTGLSPALTPVHRAALEMEAERAGRAFADGRRFSVVGRAPTTAALFRGPGEEQEPEADQDLDASIQEVLDRQAARGTSIAKDRRERQDYILAHLEWREYDVPVDERLRRTPTARQPQELWIRVLQMEFPSINRENAEEILRRTGIKAWSAESGSIAEQIRTRGKIQFRTKYMRLLTEVYNEIVEDRARASVNVEELLNPGPDMALQIFKDVGRGYYNGILGFGQGLVDLPAAPVNLIQSLRGGEQRHILDLSGLRADYHTSYGVHYGSSIELGTQLGLMVVSGKLPLGAGAGTGAAANTASQASRAARLFSTWSKLNAVSAGATSVVQAEQALRDIARGYVIEDGKKRPLTEDDIVGRLAGIAFGLHAAKSALRGTPGKSGSGPGSSPEAAIPDMSIEPTTPSPVAEPVPTTEPQVLSPSSSAEATGGGPQGLTFPRPIDVTQAAKFPAEPPPVKSATHMETASPRPTSSHATIDEAADLHQTEAKLAEQRAKVASNFRQQQDIARSIGDKADLAAERNADKSQIDRLEDAFDAQQKIVSDLEAELRGIDADLNHVRSRIQNLPSQQSPHLAAGKQMEGEVGEAFNLGPKNNQKMVNPDPAGADFIPDHIEGNPTSLRWGKAYHFKEIKDWADMSDTGNLSAMLDYVKKINGSRLTIYYKSNTYMSEPLRTRIEGLVKIGQVTLVPFAGN